MSMEQNEYLKGWKRPDEVMKLHRLKLKRRSLYTRCVHNEKCVNDLNSSINNEETLMEYPKAKRRNPFKRFSSETTNEKTKSTDGSSWTSESGIEMNLNTPVKNDSVLDESDSLSLTPNTFHNILQHIEDNNMMHNHRNKNHNLNKSSVKRIPVDWSLKYKLRFMSTKPFSWSAKLKTCEEASATTGFVRCLNQINIENCNIDTTTNSKFHQCCMYWQHPNLPWVNLFPRNATAKSSSGFAAFQSSIASTLQGEWEKAFRSLFQLITARQCPYFYLVSDKFNCLFRAAGIGGMSEINAVLTSSTRGLRKMLDDEDVSYTLPLRKKTTQDDSTESVKEVTSEDEDDGDDLLDSIVSHSQDARKFIVCQKQIDHKREIKSDEIDDTLILVQGSDTQAFFNVLVNCKSLVCNYGSMTAIPPTLLSPTAFSLASLKSLRVLNGVVHVNGAKFYSIEVEGPVLPHTLRQFCHLLDSDSSEYSAMLATLKSTRGFTQMVAEHKNNGCDNSTMSASSVFAKANLSDCGLSDHMVDIFCDNDFSHYGIIESIEPSLQQLFNV